MKTKEEIIKDWIYDKPLIKLPEAVSGAMDEWAKIEAIEFFKWYGIKFSGLIEYITKIKPLVKSEEIEEKILEFEGQSIERLYELYQQSKK